MFNLLELAEAYTKMKGRQFLGPTGANPYQLRSTLDVIGISKIDAWAIKMAPIEGIDDEWSRGH